jgi:hypothetical protein
MKNVPIAVFKNDEDVDRIIWFYDLPRVKETWRNSS